MLGAGEVISYLDMCREEGVNLQRGMNFQLASGRNVILMSLRKGAPYADRIEEEGRVLTTRAMMFRERRRSPIPSRSTSRWARLTAA
jgi:hypothetical protein